MLLVTTGWWLWADVWKNGKEIRKYKKELRRLDKQFQDILEATENYDAVKERHGFFLEEFDSLKAVIPDRSSYVNVLESIRKVAERQHVEIITLSPIREDSYPAIKRKLKFTGKHIERYPVQLRVLGDFLTLGAFFEELLSMPPVVNIGRISLETELETGGVLACELVLYTYMFLDEAKNTV